MKDYDLEYVNKKEKCKVRKFKDLYDDDYNEIDEKDYLKRKKKLGKQRRINKTELYDWPNKID